MTAKEDSKWNNRKKCSAIHCKNYPRRSNVTHLAFHRFPKDPDRCARWVQNIRNTSLKRISSQRLHQIYRVCSAHFDPSQFKIPSNVHAGLKWDAVPTRVNAPNPPPQLDLELRRKPPMKCKQSHVVHPSSQAQNIVCLKMICCDPHEHHKVSYLLTNNLNKECLEKACSTVRARGGNHDSPVAVQFECEYQAVATGLKLDNSEETEQISDEHCYTSQDSPSPRITINTENIIDEHSYARVTADCRVAEAGTVQVNADPAVTANMGAKADQEVMEEPIDYSIRRKSDSHQTPCSSGDHADESNLQDTYIKEGSVPHDALSASVPSSSEKKMKTEIDLEEDKCQSDIMSGLQKEHDAEELFLLSLAPALRKLPEEEMSKTKLAMMQLLHKAQYSS